MCADHSYPRSGDFWSIRLGYVLLSLIFLTALLIIDSVIAVLGLGILSIAYGVLAGIPRKRVRAPAWEPVAFALAFIELMLLAHRLGDLVR